MAATDGQTLLRELAGWTAGRGPAPATYAYGDDPEQVADLRLPEGPGPHPLAVLLHGGFWRAPFTRTLMDALAIELAARGWASWNVEYRRVGNGGGVPETLDDVRAAIAAIADAHRISGPLERTRLVLVGHSAGGQLALCAAGEPAVAATVALAGVCDLDAAARDGIGDGAAVAFMGATRDQRPAAYALADPLRRLPAGTPVLLVHGDADQRVPVAQSRDYARAAAAAGDRCELLELQGIGHFELIDPRTPTWQLVVEGLDGLLAE